MYFALDALLLKRYRHWYDLFGTARMLRDARRDMTSAPVADRKWHVIETSKLYQNSCLWFKKVHFTEITIKWCPIRNIQKWNIRYLKWFCIAIFECNDSACCVFNSHLPLPIFDSIIKSSSGPIPSHWEERWTMLCEASFIRMSFAIVDFFVSIFRPFRRIFIFFLLLRFDSHCSLSSNVPSI